MSRNQGIPPRSARHLLLFVPCLTATMLGCSSSTLVDMWVDPQPPPEPLKNVLVVAMKQDAARRRLWEDEFVAKLAAQGVAATPSYREFETAAPDSQQVVAAVQEKGYDGVLVAHGLGTETQTRHVPGYTTSEPVTRRNPWSGQYYTYWRNIHHPGYTESELIVTHQVDVWSTRQGGNLVWTGTLESHDPSSSSTVDQEIAALVVPELAAKGLIPSGK